MEYFEMGMLLVGCGVQALISVHQSEIGVSDLWLSAIFIIPGV